MIFGMYRYIDNSSALSYAQHRDIQNLAAGQAWPTVKGKLDTFIHSGFVLNIIVAAGEG